MHKFKKLRRTNNLEDSQHSESPVYYDIDREIESDLDIRAPILATGFTIDSARDQRILQRICQTPAPVAPEYSDRFTFTEYTKAQYYSLVVRGDFISSSRMTDKEREQFLGQSPAADITTMLISEPREAQSELTGPDPSELPEMDIEVSGNGSEKPGTSKQLMDVELPSLDLGPSTSTNLGIQDGIRRQERSLFPELRLSYEGPTTLPAFQPQSTAESPPASDSKTGLDQLTTQVTEIQNVLKNTANLVKAQSGLFTLLKEVQTEVKALSAEVLALRSETTQLHNLQKMWIAKISSTVPMQAQSTPTAPMPAASGAPLATDSAPSDELLEKINAYYDHNLSQLKLAGLTKPLFATLTTAPDPYLQATQLFPGLKLPKENFACFINKNFTHVDIDVINREFMRVSSSLHKQSYLPPGGTGVPYQSGALFTTPLLQPIQSETTQTIQTDAELTSFFIPRV